MPEINVKHELSIHDALKSDRAYWDTWWQQINEFCLPRRAYITENESTPDGDQFDRVYDTTAMAAVAGLSQMMTSRLTPYSQQWQQWGVAPELEDDEEAVSWMQKMSEICMKYKAQSAFYREIHNVNEDKAGPGTGCLYLGHGSRSKFFDYKYIDLGTYSFTENAEGVADSMWREFKVTGIQAKEMFPEGQFVKTLASAANASQPSDFTKKFTILQVVRPRKDRNENMIDRANMPYEELYICVEDENLIQEGGYETFPFMVTRFQKWGNQHVWGVSPCRKAMPAIHQANFLQEMADELVELQVRPRFKQLASMVGQVDLRAGGRTLGESVQQLDALQEWATQGRPDVAMARIEQKQKDINNLFYAGLWNTDTSQMTRNVTAKEIEHLERRDQLLFSPVLSGFMVDSQPLAKREYQMLMEAGKHPEIPASIKEYMGDTGELPDPVFTTKTELSMAIDRQHAAGTDRMIERLMVISQLDPTLVDEFDLAAAMRATGRSEGMSEDAIRPKDEVIEIKSARAEAQAEAAQLEKMGQVAEAAGKAPEGMVDMAMGGGV
jgi:hypothetical protein